MKKARILVLCTQNSCRSQMAEGLILQKYGDRVDVVSAGAKPADKVHPMAVEAIKRRGIDISNNVPKNVMQFMDESYDIIITTCDSARATCPFFPGNAEHIHWDIQDPASAEGSQEEILAVFMKTADTFSSHIDDLEKKIEAINKSED